MAQPGPGQHPVSELESGRSSLNWCRSSHRRHVDTLSAPSGTFLGWLVSIACRITRGSSATRKLAKPLPTYMAKTKRSRNSPAKAQRTSIQCTARQGRSKQVGFVDGFLPHVIPPPAKPGSPIATARWVQDAAQNRTAAMAANLYVVTGPVTAPTGSQHHHRGPRGQSAWNG